ncbi:kelch-like protein 5 isoform X2 [Pollicipes pollicipes]|nr:kelch-like protein 5 isoform X2 [Pollicipes pollicipes]XP_037072490.1 kelch-like protein 5 isoform X2 [Pollicipes pollicipes]
MASEPTAGADGVFRASGHADGLLVRMDRLRLQHALCDVTLVADGRRIPAHRLLLSAASPYFEVMFTHDVLEARAPVVELKQVDPDALQMVVDFCYTGCLELNEQTVELLLTTASLLQLSQIQTACCHFLEKQLHPSNCIGIGLFAERQGCQKLHRSVQRFTADKFVDVIRNNEFLDLPPDEVAALLALDDLNIPSEEVIFYALNIWLNHDLKKRRKHLAQLMPLVRLPLVSPQFVVDRIQCSPVFSSDRTCLSLMLESQSFHLLPERRFSVGAERTRPRKATVGTLYAIGGMDREKGSTVIERYDLRSDRWVQCGFMTSRRLQFGVAIIEERLYVVGGREGLKTLNTVECYDPVTQCWSCQPPMNNHRHGLGVAVLGGPLYAVGGHDGWGYLNTVERWDPHTKLWSYVGNMQHQRSTCGVAALNGRLYAVGGRDGSSCLRSCESFDPHTNRWSAAAPMLQRRGGVGVGVVNGCLYALGGSDAPATSPNSLKFSCVERYDPNTDQWTEIASMVIGRDGVAACALGQWLFAVGGSDGQQYLRLVECYDPQTNEWKKSAPLSIARAAACVAVVKPVVPAAVSELLAEMPVASADRDTSDEDDQDKQAG